MQVVYLGKHCFKVRVKKSNLLIGPLDEKSSKIKADIVISPNKEDQKYLDKLKEKPFFIWAPGEYEVSGITVLGIKGIFVVEADELRFCYLSDLTKLEAKLDKKQLEEVDGVDVLAVSIGKEKASKAVAITKQIQPIIAIPVDEESVTKFFKELNHDEVKEEERLVVSKSSLPEEETRVMVLKAKNG